jgi:hypothetical protein
MNTECNITFSKGFIIAKETVFKPMPNFPKEELKMELNVNEDGEFSFTHEAL